MRLLLDTHIVFWCLTNDPHLSRRHRDLILDDKTLAFVSAATGWEIATKVRLGKWPEAAILLPDLTLKIVAARMHPLPLTLAQTEAAGRFEADHKDPFDRLIAAQAIDQGLTLISVDKAMAAFGCLVEQ